jgi:hypothetical protein
MAVYPEISEKRTVTYFRALSEKLRASFLHGVLDLVVYWGQQMEQS